MFSTADAQKHRAKALTFAWLRQHGIQLRRVRRVTVDYKPFIGGTRSAVLLDNGVVIKCKRIL